MREIFVLTFQAHGPHCVRFTRLECQNKYSSYQPRARLIRAQYFKRRHLIIYLLPNSEISPLGYKFWTSNLIGKIMISQKVHIYTITRIKISLEGGGGIFWGVQTRGTEGEGGHNFSNYVSIPMIIVFMTLLPLEVKHSRQGKISLCGVKIHRVGTSKTVKCAGFNS